MRQVTAVVAAVAAAVVAVAAAQGGSHAAATQRVVIKGDLHGFTLTAMSAGALKSDRGSASFCCWTTRTIVRNGQRVDIADGPEMTLVGKRGTLVAHNRMEWLDVSGGYALFTGTWTVVSGTGAYAHVTGGGRIAGISLPTGANKWRREGLIHPK